MAKRKICVVTGTRAEYGLLHWLMREIAADPALKLQIAVTGSHLSPAYGSTYKAIEADGLRIDAKVKLNLADNSPRGVARALAQAVSGFADAFTKLRPDIVVVLGDRYEVLGASQAAMVLGLPLAHLHGGERTEGVIDEAIRHSITKMAHFHFVAAEQYRKRVIQLGEQPARVKNFGAPGLENIKRLKLLAKPELERSLGTPFSVPTFVVTFHPTTLGKSDPARDMRELLAALDRFPDAKVIFTKANADAGGALLNELIDGFAAKRGERVRTFASLGQLRYLSALKHCDVVIGNSSSGIIEAPALKRPTVNIGDRQRGRLLARSIISCGENRDEIVRAIAKALSPKFRLSMRGMRSPYGSGAVAARIKNFLKTADLTGLPQKRFHDA